MSKILVVFGATGQQGGSVIKTVLADPELSKTYKIRAVTRDTSKPSSQAFSSQGVEVIQADAEDISSLGPAMKNAHTVFSLTTTIYDDELKAREIRQGKAIADAAVAAGVQYLIFSSLPHVSVISDGKYPGVEGFDSKAEVETYIRGLPIKSSFFMPGGFLQNFHTGMKPNPVGDGTYVIANVISPQTKMPLIDAADDSGKYIAAILAEPEKFEGKVLSASTDVRSFEEIVKTMSEVSGKTIMYRQLPEEVFRGFMKRNEIQAENLTQMMLYSQDFGYYGPGTKDKVAETAKLARGKLTTLEDYLKKNPLDLQ
ncbi:hypothetical protein EG329_011920 [Mollisiaceae sp. DMI_Dod_QoI]|nr:hypothetical protein EG329_011920 [Helotiales sp. DMI_Dod_QoI]